MVGHIAAPNVTGDGTPATLSPQLVALIPDAENTLIVTDSLAMDAITAAYTPGEAAVQALQAGCDVLLMPNSLPEAYAPSWRLCKTARSPRNAWTGVSIKSCCTSSNLHRRAASPLAAANRAVTKEVLYVQHHLGR